MTDYDRNISLNTLRSFLNKNISNRNLAIQKIKEEKIQLKLAEEINKDSITAQCLIQQIAQETQQQSHKQLTSVVSKCLSAVFQEPYELRINFERKRGKTEAQFIYLRNGRKEDPKLTSGGVMQVTALALRLGSLMISLPPARRFLCLDEPFLGLSKHNLEKIAVLLEVLSKELGVQFLIITHNDALQIGKVVELS